MRIVNIRRNELEIQYLSELMAYVFIAIEIDRAWKARVGGRRRGRKEGEDERRARLIDSSTRMSINRVSSGIALSLI